MNDFHLSILKKSIDEWNQWRTDHWNIKPDLSGADLRKVSLFKANLEECNLSNCDLRGATLMKVNGRSANFEGSRMEGAKLQGSDFSLANFKDCDMRNANLMGTIFKRTLMAGVDFSGANCTGTRFVEANVGDAIFYNAKVKGANFEGSNIQDAELYADQFKDANIPLEQVGIVEQKKKTGIAYAKSALSVSIVVIVLFIIYLVVFKSEDPTKPTTWIRGTLYMHTGSLYEAVGSNQMAIKYYERSEKYNPYNARVYFLMGSLYRREKNTPLAIANYKKYLAELEKESEKDKGKHGFFVDERRRKRGQEEEGLTEYIRRHGGTIP